MEDHTKNFIDDDELQKMSHQDTDFQNTEEGLIYDPFNIENKEIRLNQVQSILNEYGISANIYNLSLIKKKNL